ncbi:MAG: FAD-binding oxidoreductase [Saprospiraceae bacterium]|nr:FAD-binding oxidoreductase [Saprospiraceae bacterium]MCF8248578.1 FAD-binding oxidoreductase [Saprospiraceae bacterium]MCF8280255.1 FAD-binding oxidoreductase [Bacteroidales bacterium]MCF8310311.1 FAD-binding oxidoreductase [Saprospiraceae bacterium]MCF8439249.1 FAD-binding oxidoreductase [Saprospiraceae bacterium]
MEKKQPVDYIIVGQGLAGTLLSYFLLLENQRVVVLDYPHEGRSSNVASGLVTPVTGRRIAKSWRFEELSRFAKQTYLSLGADLGVEIWHERSIVRALHSVFEENEWTRRSGYPEFQAFMNDAPDLSDIKGKIQPPHAWGELLNCAQVAMPLLVETWRASLLGLGIFFEENIDYQQIKEENGRVIYGQWSAKKLVFCEGAKAVQNPYFKHLPFLVTKGEVLIVRIPGLPAQRILKHKLFLVPLGNSLFWVGSTSHYEFEGASPSTGARVWLLKEVEKTLMVPYEVVGHLAGIRPTVSDLRPFLGVHQEHANLSIFNGLGTKGALLGPFFAKQMTEYLLGRSELEFEVDIARFENDNRSGHFFSK